ncbi:MAG: polysaccharide biosynthesis C-terminal domain-containing protein [Bacteroidales bacterium]|nr:polysaccharide biosynthesis C-terminal domain-containing protein [Bacteroidales bacterium]
MTQSLQRSLFSGLFWVLLLNLIVKPFWILGIEVGVQNAVGAEAYGLYFTLFNLAYIFNILLDVGITNYNTRNIARHPQLLQKHLSSILSIKLLLMAGYLTVTLTIGMLIGYEGRQFRLLLLLCFNQFLNSLILYLRSNFEGLLLFRWDSVLSVMDRVLMIFICGGLLVYCRKGGVSFPIEWFVYAQTCAYFLTAVCAIIPLLHRTGMRRLHWNRYFTIVVLRKSAPFALLVLLMACYNRIDPILLSILSPQADTDAGIYASAFRLLDALTMIAYLVSVPLLPIFARLTNLHQETAHNELGSVIRVSFSLLMVFAIAASITLSSLHQPIMEILYQEHTEASAKVFQTLIYCIIPLAFTYVFGTLLTAGGYLKQLNILAVITLIVNIVINLFLIPYYGAVGSAWASLVAQSFMAAAQTMIALNIFRLKPSFSYILKILIFTLLIVVYNQLCTMISFVWWGQSLIVIAVSIAAAIAMKILDIQQISHMIQKKENHSDTSNH